MFRDSFIYRKYDVLISNLDTELKWLELQSELDDSIRQDYL